MGQRTTVAVAALGYRVERGMQLPERGLIQLEAAMETVQTETSGKLAALVKCAHSACVCTVGPGERYCGDHCAELAATSRAGADEECGCGHAECVATVGAHGVLDGFDQR